MTPEALKTFRKRLGLSQSEFAAYVGLKARETVQRWESGKIAIPRTIEIMLAGKVELPKREERPSGDSERQSFLSKWERIIKGDHL